MSNRTKNIFRWLGGIFFTLYCLATFGIQDATIIIKILTALVSATLAVLLFPFPYRLKYRKIITFCLIPIWLISAHFATLPMREKKAKEQIEHKRMQDSMQIVQDSARQVRDSIKAHQDFVTHQQDSIRHIKEAKEAKKKKKKEASSSKKPSSVYNPSRASVQCRGTTKSGSRCRRNTTETNGYCYQHGG
jgi:hypothetical protein